jgi:hypothetical protein
MAKVFLGLKVHLWQLCRYECSFIAGGCFRNYFSDLSPVYLRRLAYFPIHRDEKAARDSRGDRERQSIFRQGLEWE